VGLCRGVITLFCHGSWAYGAQPAGGSNAACTVAVFQDALLSFAAQHYEEANLQFAEAQRLQEGQSTIVEETANAR
jgi:hypothetical protein